jgi:non-heme chloroperoxidase
MTLVRVSGGADLAVQDLGSGRPVVLVAGFGLDHRVWDRQVSALTRAGFRAVCVDQRGHGRSDKPLDGYDVPQLARDLLDILEMLDLRPVTLVGHSFAGQVAFRAAVAEASRAGTSRIDSLVLVGSNAVRASRSDAFPFGAAAADILPGLLAAEHEDRLASRRANLALGFAAPPPDPVLDWLTQMSLQMPSWAALACYHSMLETDQVPDVGRVTVPVLQVIGANDPVHSGRGAAWLSQRLARARLVRLEQSGHYPMLEAGRAFDEALLGFLHADALAAKL